MLKANASDEMSAYLGFQTQFSVRWFYTLFLMLVYVLKEQLQTNKQINQLINQSINIAPSSINCPWQYCKTLKIKILRMKCVI